MQLSTHCAFFTRAIGFGDIRSLLRGPRRAVRGARKQAQARGVKGGRWGGLLCRGMAWTWASQQRAREKTIEVQKLESMRCLGGNFGGVEGQYDRKIHRWSSHVKSTFPAVGNCFWELLEGCRGADVFITSSTFSKHSCPSPWERG